MTQPPQLTVLVENTTSRADLHAEHGFSVFLETARMRILFDGGQGTAAARNAEALGLDLRTAQAVVLSHGHYDHADGLAEMGQRLTRARLFVHPGAWRPRFAGSLAGGVRPVGCQRLGRVRARALVAGVVETKTWTQLGEDIWVTGEIPRRHELEDPGDPFFLDRALQQPDAIVDDQALVLRTAGSYSVVLGCGHAGVINTLDHVAEHTGASRFALVLGGMHLRHASPERVEWTVASLKRRAVERIGPAHCTGEAATARLRQAWGREFVTAQTGSRVSL